MFPATKAQMNHYSLQLSRPVATEDPGNGVNGGHRTSTSDWQRFGGHDPRLGGTKLQVPMFAGEDLEGLESRNLDLFVHSFSKLSRSSRFVSTKMNSK